MYVISQRRRCLRLRLDLARVESHLVSSLASPRLASLLVHVPIIILARRNAPQAAIQQSVGHTDSWPRQQTVVVAAAAAATALKPNHNLAFFYIFVF